jgi:hypothetical protein
VDGENVVRDFITGSAAEAIALGKKLAQFLWRNDADKILADQNLNTDDAE